MGRPVLFGLRLHATRLASHNLAGARTQAVDDAGVGINHS